MDTRELYYDTDFEIALKPENAENTLYNQMVAMGRALVEAKKNMSMTEYKILIMALTKIQWTKSGNKLEVELDKKEVAEVLGFVNDKTLSQQLRTVFRKLMMNSMICIDGETEEEWNDGMLVTNTRSTRGNMYLTFNSYYSPLLEELTKSKDFVTIWANDIYQFESVYAYLLFEELRTHGDTRRTNWRTYSTKELKELFGLNKDAYMHYDSQKGKEVFDRSNFEKKVLDKAITEINKGQMINIYPIINSVECKKGKFYEKVKKNGYVVGYMFKYVIKTRTVEPERLELLDGQLTVEDLNLI